VKIIDNKKNECPNIKNHSAIAYDQKVWIFGGYDGKKNHSTLHVYNIKTNTWSRPTTKGF